MKALLLNITDFSLKTKFIIMFTLLISVPFLISGLLAYNKYASNIETNTRHATEQLVGQLALNLDRFIKEVERLTLTPVSDKGVLRVLNNHSMVERNAVYLTTDEEARMAEFFVSTIFDRAEISGILIFTNNGLLFGNTEGQIDKSWTAQGSEWMDQVVKEKGALTIIQAHDVNYYEQGTRRVVSLARVIREPLTHRTLGIIKVDLEASGFEEIFASVQLDNGGRLYIYDNNEQLIYPREAIVSHPDLNDPNMLTATGQSRFAELNIIAQIPYKELNKQAGDLIHFTLVISLLSLGLAFLLAILSAKTLIKPILHLQSKMKLIHKGVFWERAAVTNDDEIGQLTAVFNRMMDEIDRLVHEVYETNLREREAELAVLQGQMNPHFLYNSLETINMLGVKENQWEIVNFTSSLGRLLRYTVDRKQTAVTLLDELLFVESYLQIQSIRNNGRIHFSNEIDPALVTAIVPKLILQPLVENALEHGMDESPLTIRMQATLDQEGLIVVVEDDGVGMDEAMLQATDIRLRSRNELQKASGFGKPTRGHGLHNVHHRIRLLYGEHYGLTIRRNAERGIAIQIRLPFRWEE